MGHHSGVNRIRVGDRDVAGSSRERECTLAVDAGRTEQSGRVAGIDNAARRDAVEGEAPGAGRAKYPFTSINTSVALLANRLTWPVAPPEVKAALAVIVPVGAFRFETPGQEAPAGHAERNPSGP